MRLITPHSISTRDKYARLFPPAAHPPEVSTMIALGRAMGGNLSPIPAAQQRTPLPAGYTYFGQFIDHDLTFELTPLNEAGNLEPTAITNTTGASLDLGQLYGGGPGSANHAHLYEGDTFKLGNPTLPNGEKFDVPLSSTGNRLPHPHNYENIILRQLHAMFLKLHNLALTDLPTNVPAHQRFAKACQRVQWQYQWLVRNDYLRRICYWKVYQQIAGHPSVRRIDWSAGFAIPVEFSQAAFRFGHSMVRESYRLNPQRLDVPLSQLFALERAKVQIDSRDAVDWRAFFTGGETAKAIKTRIALPLTQLPMKPSHGDLPSELAVRTLIRGAKGRLPSGEEVERYLGRSPLRKEAGADDAREAWQLLDALGLTNNTPLWFYILLEAEIERHGASLGSIGSWLVAEVIEEALRSDPESYLSQNGQKWIPEPWPLKDGTRLPIRTMADLAIVTGYS